jgi:rubrerythrin
MANKPINRLTFKSWKCSKCGYVVSGPMQPVKCPKCSGGAFMRAPEEDPLKEQPKEEESPE